MPSLHDIFFNTRLLWFFLKLKHVSLTSTIFYPFWLQLFFRLPVKLGLWPDTGCYTEDSRNIYNVFRHINNDFRNINNDSRNINNDFRNINNFLYAKIFVKK
ncbi:hypothetical protein CDIK_2727 [Cucumispora dikerogammari]|nr:hypothetical protein CDIK_2727 [Cucumispora dikerogammari]